VIEVGLPAEHLTMADHELELPTARLAPERWFGGQRFCRSEGAHATWGEWRLPGWEARETGIGEATGGVAEVRVVRPVRPVRGQRERFAREVEAKAAERWRHSADVWFGFVLVGEVTFCAEDRADVVLAAGDAITVPPSVATALVDATDDLELLEVALPARFATVLAG
jgi:quercetin dioxygenase-like cupin family protein